MISCSHHSSARSSSATTRTSSEMNAAVIGGALDLGEAVCRRGIDAGDELEVEDQKPALRAVLQQRLDVLVEPVGRAEEQVALQVQALDLSAMGFQSRP